MTKHGGGLSKRDQVKAERAFLARLRSAIDASGMNQSELAARVGCGASTVTEWFQRGSMPKGHIMIHLPTVLGVSGAWLLSGEGPMMPTGTTSDVEAERRRTALEVLAMIESAVGSVRGEWSERERPVEGADAATVEELDAAPGEGIAEKISHS